MLKVLINYDGSLFPLHVSAATSRSFLDGDLSWAEVAGECTKFQKPLLREAAIYTELADMKADVITGDFPKSFLFAERKSKFLRWVADTTLLPKNFTKSDVIEASTILSKKPMVDRDIDSESARNIISSLLKKKGST